MHKRQKSDTAVVPMKQPNNAGQPAAETVEGRVVVKGNARQSSTSRMQGRTSVNQALGRIRDAAKRDKKGKLTSLLHHIYAVDALREAYFSLKREAAAGVDGETWQHYGEDLEEHLQDLSGRLARGAYRASPVRRVYIPKADGRQQRPIGVPVLEDKIVQRATVAVLNAVYETEFLGFSYGFRPGKSQHDALQALSDAIVRTKVSWVLDADIRGFYDTISHEWLVKFVEHRIGDKRVVRLIQKWLRAGVLEEGQWTGSEEGTPQGGSASPLLSNIYLHYSLDMWVQQWKQRQARGQVVVVRWADDFIVGFEHWQDAEQFLAELKERFQTFGLELHPEKTRLLEFGRHAAESRKRRGLGKPETFDFLGFTHVCGKTRKGKFTVKRLTMRTRLRSKLKAVKAGLRQRLHVPVRDVGKWLQSVVTGHYRYYGVTGNYRALYQFREGIKPLWRHVLRRRSQRGKAPWSLITRLSAKWLPRPHIYHSYTSLIAT
ncbi:MAG: group II intron reverse transcriptase/maturase [Chloroflexota bacterium]|nr:group II intron reverse transcriptase/maturase [Chloroflexota bacterium]